MVSQGEIPNLSVRPLVKGEAETLLRSVLSAVDVGILLTDCDHQSLACNQRFGEMWGIDPEDAVRSDVQTVRRMVGKRIPDIASWEANLEQVYADPRHIQTDDLVLRSPKAVLRRYTAPVIEGDVVAGRLWTFLDITAENRHRRMRESLQEASFFFDPDPRVVYEAITEAVSRFYGSLALLSIRVGDFMVFQAVGGPSDSPARNIRGNELNESYCQFCLAKNSPTIIQDARANPLYANILPAKHGLTRYAGVPVISPSGDVTGTLCILDERSDETLDEEDLRFLSLMALRISGEIDRERQLQQIQGELVVAQKRLVQTEKLAVVGTLSATVAHDIRNILAAVSLDIELGRKEPETTLETVRMHLDRFAVLSYRLLAYAKPKPGSRCPVDILEAVETVTSLLGAHLKLAQINLIVEVAEGLPHVASIPGRLEHVLVNLTMNAIQAMKSGGTLTLRAYHDCDLVLEVIDTGQGIADEQLSSLFEPFVSARVDGFGLGLYSVAEIVKELGGEINVTSEVGLGTRFQLRLKTV